MAKIRKVSESISLSYLDELHDNGAISSNVYNITKDLSKKAFAKFDLIGDENDIKKRVLNLLDDNGGISSDVFEMEMSELD